VNPNITIEIDKESWDKAKQEIIEFSRVCQETNQRLQELHIYIQEIKTRYGILWPMLLFFMKSKGNKS
jgi:hypothetical protein